MPYVRVRTLPKPEKPGRDESFTHSVRNDFTGLATAALMD